ncbi:MAG: hypothetical protein K2O34_14105 [Acetatifactor sp.]|nr:hypothetical protein [Acetatifactor sp.]
MICVPDHIKEYVKPIAGENKLFDGYIGEYTFAYEVVCSCGNKELIVYKNSEPKVTAFCEACGKAITLYDLIEYPCAVALRDDEDVMEKVTNEDTDKFHVAIIFEYSDEFTLDDERFDVNDVTWCQIYLYDMIHLQSILLVNDETA